MAMIPAKEVKWWGIKIMSGIQRKVGVFRNCSEKKLILVEPSVIK